MRFRRRNNCVAPVSKGGAAPWVRDAAHEAAEWRWSRVAAPHHEAERDRPCIQIDRNPI